MYHLQIVTPESIIYDNQASSLIAPGIMGYLEVLTDHAMLLTVLKSGRLTVTDSALKKLYWTITGGVLEVHHNQVIVLADTLTEIKVQEKAQSLF